MTDSARPTTLAEVVTRLRALCANCEEPECQCCRDTIAACDAADALSTAQSHAAQLVELNMALEAKATAAIEQRDAYVRELKEAVAELDRARRAMDTPTAIRAEALEIAIKLNGELMTERDELRTANERLREALQILSVVDDPAKCFQRPTLRGIAKIAKDALTPRDPAVQGVERESMASPTSGYPYRAAQKFESGAGSTDGRANQSVPHTLASSGDGLASQPSREDPSAVALQSKGEAGVEPGPAPDSLPDQCMACEGTGYAPNCTRSDRERGDLWACVHCNGSGFITPAPEAGKPTDGVEEDLRQAIFETGYDQAIDKVLSHLGLHHHDAAAEEVHRKFGARAQREREGD